MLAALTALAWWALWAGGSSPWGHSLFHSGHAMAMDGSPVALAGLFVFGWTLMTVAMMLPTSAPLILLFHRMIAGRARAGLLMGSLVGGYLAVWISFGLAVHLALRALRTAAAGVPLLDRNPWAMSAGILLVAGLYQFSSLKYACLDKCRSPLMFVTARWHGIRPARESFRLGAAHGAYCVGCCWSLMLIMFAAGMGSLGWMLVLGAAMAAEKNFSWGRRLSPVLGIVLIAGGGAVALAALLR